MRHSRTAQHSRALQGAAGSRSDPHSAVLRQHNRSAAPRAVVLTARQAPRDVYPPPCLPTQPGAHAPVARPPQAAQLSQPNPTPTLLNATSQRGCSSGEHLPKPPPCASSYAPSARRTRWHAATGATAIQALAANPTNHCPLLPRASRGAAALPRRRGPPWTLRIHRSSVLACWTRAPCQARRRGYQCEHCTDCNSGETSHRTADTARCGCASKRPPFASRATTMLR
jgi:hypothetical protein